jgi:hypothetical protein
LFKHEGGAQNVVLLLYIYNSILRPPSCEIG